MKYGYLGESMPRSTDMTCFGEKKLYKRCWRKAQRQLAKREAVEELETFFDDKFYDDWDKKHEEEMKRERNEALLHWHLERYYWGKWLFSGSI